MASASIRARATSQQEAASPRDQMLLPQQQRARNSQRSSKRHLYTNYTSRTKQPPTNDTCRHLANESIACLRTRTYSI